jgi:hypothetical protein
VDIPRNDSADTFYEYAAQFKVRDDGASPQTGRTTGFHRPNRCERPGFDENGTERMAAHAAG